MSCKACGQSHGCDHSDPEYQGIVPPLDDRRSGIDRQIELFVQAVNRGAKQIGEAFRQ